jgi:hypothetical protein
MLTKADDYPVHQLPEPIATAGTDRNFYDRYFFNGYSPDGSVFFAAALGVYPHLNVMDAAFSVIADGVQHNLRASRLLASERLDTKVGPIAVEVIEPLCRLRVRVSENAHNISADLVFDARAPAVEEPRFTWRQGPRTILDYTRLTQNGTYEGTIGINGRQIAISRAVLGTRDRSWGVRPIGAPDPQAPAPPRSPQFYWLWAPLNFSDRFVLYHNNEDAMGRSWNTAAAMGELGEAEAAPMECCESQLEFKSGTRHAKEAVIAMRDQAGCEWRVELTPRFHFYMSGLGYMHPEWGHGMWKGENALGCDTYQLDGINENDPRFLHVQAFVTARLEGPGMERDGVGVFEQLIIGPHAPSGFRELLDPAP